MIPQSSWKPMCLLPNIAVAGEVGGDVVVVVSATDERVKALANGRPGWKGFLSSFTDQWGSEINPSLILLRGDAKDSLQTAEAIAAVRDTICMSVVPLARARCFQVPWTNEPTFSDVFDIYPWMLSALGTDLTAWTPAIMATRDVSSFRGQTSPSVLPATLELDSVDKPILEALLQRWRQDFESSAENRADIALFRSLSMAFHASRAPAGQESTHFDYGRLVALWVSALEILVHPGNKVGPKQVIQHVEKISWLLKPPGHSKVHPSVGDAAKSIFKKLYQCRNDYLHGNSVTPENLKIGPSNCYVNDFAAPLYRMALATSLDLRPQEPVVGLGNQGLATCTVKPLSFEDNQKTFEECILAAA